MGDVHQIPPPNGIYPPFLSPDDFHPEFGYLCPTPRMRRKLRVIAILASIAMLIGGISVTPLAQRNSGDDHRRELARSVAIAEPTADEALATTLPSPAVVTGASSVLSAPAPCQGPAGSFVNHQCDSGKPRSPRSRPGAPHQVVFLPIGHSSAVSANEPTVSEPTAVMSDKGKAVDNVIDIAKAAAARLVDSSVPNTKPRTKIARKHRPTTSPQDNGLSAFAAAPWFGSGAHSRKAALSGSRRWGAWR
jgi:hypothetical protein